MMLIEPQISVVHGGKKLCEPRRLLARLVLRKAGKRHAAWLGDIHTPGHHDAVVTAERHDVVPRTEPEHRVAAGFFVGDPAPGRNDGRLVAQRLQNDSIAQQDLDRQPEAPRRPRIGDGDADPLRLAGVRNAGQGFANGGHSVHRREADRTDARKLGNQAVAGTGFDGKPREDRRLGGRAGRASHPLPAPLQLIRQAVSRPRRAGGDVRNCGLEGIGKIDGQQVARLGRRHWIGRAALRRARKVPSPRCGCRACRFGRGDRPTPGPAATRSRSTMPSSAVVWADDPHRGQTPCCQVR